jgi:hypothetical protein
MNFILPQHGYRRFIWQDGSDEEHIITDSWWCKPAVVMDYHRQLVRQNDGDSYQPGRSYELTVILPSPMVRITNRW